jgi:AcrR family transcriptional regulator
VTTTERPMRADARRNQEKLIDVARAAFGELGVDAPMDEIARRAGVGPGTLYRHFPTKDALLAAVYRRDVESMARRAEELSAELPPLEALQAWMSEQLGFMSFKIGLGAAIKAMLGRDSETMQFCRATMNGAIDNLLEAAQKDGAIRTDVNATTVLRMLHGIGVASESDPSLSKGMLTLLLDGLRATPAA